MSKNTPSVLPQLPTKEVIFNITRVRNQRVQDEITDNVPLIDVINWTDEKGNLTERRIRYIPGSPSIFADEQSKDYNAEWERTKMRPRSLKVYNGQYRAEPNDRMLMMFLLLCNYNKSNPSRKESVEPIIEQYDVEVIAKKSNEASDDRYFAEKKVREMDEAELRAHLITMSDVTTNESISKYRSMEYQQLKNIGLNMANENPKRFLESLTSAALRSKYIIINAVIRKIITFNEQTNALSYANGDVIMPPTNGMNAIDALAELSVNSPSHKAIVEDLYNKMAERMSSGEKSASQLPDTKNVPVKDEYDALFDKCIKLGIISVSGQWHTINNKSTDPAEKVPIKVQGYKNLKAEVKKDKSMVIELYERIEEAEQEKA